MEAYRDQQEILEQNEEDAAEYAFILIDKIKSMNMTEIQLRLMDAMLNKVQAQMYVNQLLDFCYQKIQELDAEPDDQDINPDIPQETLMSNFVSESYYSRNKNNLLTLSTQGDKFTKVNFKPKFSGHNKNNSSIPIENSNIKLP